MKNEISTGLEASFPNFVISYVPTSTLHQMQRNVRRHSRRKIQRLTHFMVKSRIITPLLIDQNNTVILGNARLEALRYLLFTEVPVIKVDHLTPAMIRSLVIAENQFCISGDWDKKYLARELAALGPILKEEFDLDLTDLGFETAEVDLLLGDISLSADADTVPEVTAGSTVSKKGCIWIMGEHRLVCGDARDEAIYKSLMGTALAEMVFADLPYNVPTEGHICGNGAIQHREFAMAAGEMTPEQFIAFMAEIFALLRKYSKEGSVHMQCMDWRHSFEILSAAREAGYTYLNMACWVKHVGGMGSFLRSQHELVHIFQSGKGPFINNVMLGKYGRNRTNVWNYEGANSFSKARKDDLALHPTVKPVDLIADAIKDCSDRGGIVLDCCGGSGSTLIACEQTARIARLIEIDEHYCDVIVQRWQRTTGNQAVLELTGETFDQLSAATEVKNDRE
jgi:DNA modification methylase